MPPRSPWFHAHTHSEFSTLDAISSVEKMVAKAAKMDQPALALTDHGNMSGTVKLYRAGQKHGIQVFPGFEGYLVEDTTDKKAQRYHIGLIAPTLAAYRALVRLSSLSHTRDKFQRFPRFDLSDLAALSQEDGGDEVILTTGCFFGLPQQTLVTQTGAQAQRIVEMYARWFPNTFVEIQNHSINHVETETSHGGYMDDAQICKAMVDIANTVGLPVVATQDAHYSEPAERSAHDLMKRMVYRGQDGANEFPGTFHLASTKWVQKHHHPDHWDLALEGAQTMLDLHDLEIPPLDKFKAHFPASVKNPLLVLARACRAGLEELNDQGKLKKPFEQYERMLRHELDIIRDIGGGGYFMTWIEFVAWCKQNHICIEARGSANGSVVCYALGITGIDPLQRKLLFERFLSRDRKKPPDIDMDIEDVRRDEAVAWLQAKFGVVQIGTFGSLGAREGDDRGSVLVSYNSYLRSKTASPALFNKLYGPKGLESIDSVAQHSEEDYKGLRYLAASDVKRSYGVHPAGLLLDGADLAVREYIPTMLVASSGTTVTQFNMDDVEEFGLIKKDLLGQRTLTIMRRTQEMIGRKDPTDFSWIPDDDPETCKTLRAGVPDNGIFQFEGYAMAKGARSLQIRNTNDCILAGALFRPACMDSGMTDLYIDRRRDKNLRVGLKYPHPAFEEVLRPTYGVVLFQEQVLEILRKVGLSYDDINAFFKIVKDSGKGATERNELRAAEVRTRWDDICEKNDIEDPDEAWHYIEGYTKYGFNKAHSAGYGVRSYRVAYLKTHHQLEFMAALLECNAGLIKEEKYIREARRLNIRILPPDVNISGPKWTLDTNRGAIRKGLSSIKGVGDKAAQDIAANAPYDTIEELIEKNPPRSVSGAPAFRKDGSFSGVLAKLRDANALVSLGYRKDDDD